MKRKPKTAPRKQTRRINKKAAFLAAYIVTADLTAAAAAVGINRGQHYAWLRKDKKYVADFALADIEATQTIYDSALNRALVGVYEPTVYQGRFSFPQEVYEIEPAIPAILDPAGNVTTAAIPARLGLRDIPGSSPIGVYKKSEMLHAAILRARIPAFRAGTLEVTGKDGGAIESQHRIVFVKPGEIPAK